MRQSRGERSLASKSRLSRQPEGLKETLILNLSVIFQKNSILLTLFSYFLFFKKLPINNREYYVKE